MGKISQNLSSVAVVIGALRVKIMLCIGQKIMTSALPEQAWKSTLLFVLFILLLYVPSQQLWSLRDGQFT